MIPYDAVNVHHKLLNMYDIAGRTAETTQLWKGFWGTGGNNRVFGCFSLKFTKISAFVGGNLFSPPSITIVYKGFQTSQVPPGSIHWRLNQGQSNSSCEMIEL